jgi:hypothetical protein
MDRAVTTVAAIAACAALALGLQGCGGGSPPSPPPSPSPSPAPSPSPSGGSWKLEPIVVKGSHLYGSRSGKQFFAKGIAFPNVGNIPASNLQTWIKSLEKIHELGPNINTVRIYELPDCALKPSDDSAFCSFKPFFQKADELGIYVLLPASGRIWGYFPGQPTACKPPITNSATDDLNGCYTVGGILGFGRQIINNFNFPNVLAIALANEVEQNYQAFPVLKAYARDMKAHMKLCNSDDESPTQNKMRQIPLTYAATDTGDDALMQLTDYLLCESKGSSLDIMGVNIERWTNDAGGNQQYKQLSEKVGKKNWPAAWIHTEEGGPDPSHKNRNWTQLKGFFANYSHFDGYYAFAWYSDTHDFDMFDGLGPDATEYADGKAYFDAMSKSGADPSPSPAGEPTTPDCAKTLTRTGTTYNMVDYSTIKVYDTGANGWAKNCPAPWQDMELDDDVVV